MIEVSRLAARVAVIRLDRPDALNAFTVEMMRSLREALLALESDESVDVLVITGKGRAFSAGLDLKAVPLGDGEIHHGTIPGMALQELFAGIAGQIRRMRQPVIAVINGVAVGAGFALALACDIRIVEPAARFMVGAVRIGLTAGESGISYHLPRIVGAGRAFEVMLTGRSIDHEEAAAIGLATTVVEEGGGVSQALRMADTILANGVFATKHTKQLMWSNLDAPSLDAAILLENHAQVAAMLGADFQEARSAFAARRSSAAPSGSAA